jgi:hypothetical protein
MFQNYTISTHGAFLDELLTDNSPNFVSSEKVCILQAGVERMRIFRELF